jgi:hypothetical protein
MTNEQIKEALTEEYCSNDLNFFFVAGYLIQKVARKKKLEYTANITNLLEPINTKNPIKWKESASRFLRNYIPELEKYRDLQAKFFGYEPDNNSSKNEYDTALLQGYAYRF